MIYDSTHRLRCHAWLLISIAVVMALVMARDSAAQTNFFKIPESELKNLPPFCRNGFGSYGIDPQQALYLNHLCPGLFALNVAQRTLGNDQDHRYALQEAVDHLSYTISHVTGKLPFRSSVYVKRGNAYEMQGNDANAVSDYQTAIDSDPKNTTGYTAVVDLLLKKGARDQAVKAIEKGLAANPESKALQSRKQKISSTKGAETKKDNNSP